MTQVSEQKTAFVTGGARGIGAKCAHDLKAAGFQVVIGDIDPDQIHAFEKETGIPGVVVDVASFESVVAAQKEIEEKWGRVEVLVNNAGITRDGFMHKMDPKQWQSVIDVNLGGVFNTSRVFSPSMRDAGWGRIINISSMNGQRGQFGQGNYAAAKAGILGFTRSVAQELANKGITVNAICPGFIETEMTQAMPADILEAEVKKIPCGRMGVPNDIAAAVVFLASDNASFINGATFSINGGQYMAA
ncbi:beta-ketoacyl-ACP reductase [Terasakiella sp. A23]|uniref:beta-ketoacyl-ACP reductase n=1 Tax=Terasakiella sp. FCG-A23 TaxID=3080561 RepID=UPI0029530DD8|nr:beta-ketoacyl-ACP reductase [Terasakiella sp. A23]MDV7340605.1 beta-ketoacyl-ACP reductase [Terasakiella sp. A23]